MDSLVFDTSALLNFGHRGDLAALLKRLSGEYRILTTTGARNELTDPRRKDYYAEFLRLHFTVQNPTTAPFDVATLARLSRSIDAGFSIPRPVAWPDSRRFYAGNFHV